VLRGRCSHFLLLYSDQLPLAFHVQAVREMCRVAREARIFPLLDMHGRRSSHLERVIAAMEDSGLSAEVFTVDYEFQRGGNQMLRVARQPETKQPQLLVAAEVAATGLEPVTRGL
jgi:hypothetical protein